MPGHVEITGPTIRGWYNQGPHLQNARQCVPADQRGMDKAEPEAEGPCDAELGPRYRHRRRHQTHHPGRTGIETFELSSHDQQFSQ